MNKVKVKVGIHDESDKNKPFSWEHMGRERLIPCVCS